MPRLDQLLGIIRTPFLALTPVCVLLGIGSAYWVSRAIPVGYVVLVFGGPLMVMGTHYVILGNYDATAISVSLIPFFLVSSLLLVNQLPDIEADSQVGRRHYPILIGPHASSFLYGSFLLASYLVLVGGVMMNFLPVASLLGLITLPLALKAFIGLQRLTDSSEASEFIPIMAMSVLLSLSTPLLVLAGLVLPK